MINNQDYKLICSNCNKTNIKAIKECYCFFCKNCFEELGKKILTHTYAENEICNICKKKTSIEMKFIFDDKNDDFYKFEKFIHFFQNNEIEKTIFDQKKILMNDHCEKRKYLNTLYEDKNYLTEKIKFLENIIIYLCKEKNYNLFELDTKFLINPNFSIFENLNLLNDKKISLKKNSKFNSKKNLEKNDFWKENDLKVINPEFAEFLEEEKLKKRKKKNFQEIIFKSSITSEDLLKLSKK